MRKHDTHLESDTSIVTVLDFFTELDVREFVAIFARFLVGVTTLLNRLLITQCYNHLNQMHTRFRRRQRQVASFPY
jgi:hypothetical protein